MSALVSAELQSQILSMHYGRKIGIRTIARDLGLNRKTVRAIVQRKSVIIKRSSGPQASILDPFKPLLDELLKSDPSVTAPVALARIRNQGYLGGISILKEHIAGIRKNPARAREAFLRIDFSPGECAQVDWGEFGDVFQDGVKIHCFVMVLCYSRLLYIEFTRS